MELLKRMEKELIEDWHKLQLELIPKLKAAALKAYYIKFRSYQRQRQHSLALSI